MDECYGQYFLHNGELKELAAFNPSLVWEGESVYEVLRTSKGRPFFFNDHFERLEAGVRNTGRQMLAGRETIKRDIRRLSEARPFDEINLKIVFNYRGNDTACLIYFIPTVYPDAEQYRNGVKGILYRAERHDPETKIINQGLRSSIYHRLVVEGAYEALLVNEAGQVTEGSRSNIFFCDGRRLVTAPGNLVLNGITRKHILEICRARDIDVEFSCTDAAGLKDFPAVFMTGTSPMVLPFSRIGEVSFDTSLPLIAELRELYRERAEASIRAGWEEGPPIQP